MNVGPLIHSGRTTRVLMAQTLVTLMPVCAAAVWRYGGHAAVLMVASLAGAWIGELTWNHRRALDGSALVTGVLFALLLPANSPWWLALAGGAIATLFGKHFLGGLGKNLFNPAALSRAVLMGVAPTYFFAARWSVDGVSRATPLAKEIGLQPPALRDLAWGNYPGTIGESLPAIVLLAGLLLVILRTIDWRVPLTYLTTLSLLAMILPASDQIGGHAPWLAGNPLPHLLAGGSLLTAFFMLTDPVTSPIAPSGRIAFAVLAGVYTMVVRFYTPYPDAAALAVLLANAFVPMLDDYLPGAKTV